MKILIVKVLESINSFLEKPKTQSNLNMMKQLIIYWLLFSTSMQHIQFLFYLLEGTFL